MEELTAWLVDGWRKRRDAQSKNVKTKSNFLFCKCLVYYYILSSYGAELNISFFFTSEQNLIVSEVLREFSSFVMSRVCYF